jgi:AraC-like DNA-binding protein
MRPSLSTKIMLTYGSVLFVAIALAFFLSYAGTVGRLESDLKDTNLVLLKQVEQKIEVSFRQTEKDLLALTEELEFVYFMYGSYSDESQRYSNFYGLNHKLRSFITNNPAISSIFLYSSSSGDILTDKAYMPEPSLSSNWLADHERMPEYFKWLSTHPVWDGHTTEDVVTLVRSYPTVSKPGYRKGMVAVNMKEQVLFDMVQAVYEDSELGQLLIIDQDGNVVTHDDKSQIYRNVREVPYMEPVLSKSGSGSFGVRAHGVRQTVFYRDFDYTSWKLISVLPEVQIYKPAIVIRNLLIVFALGMIALALVILFFVNRRTFRPLDRLIGKMSNASNSASLQEFANAGLPYLEKVFDQLVTDREHLERHVRDSRPVLKWRILMDMLLGYRSDYEAVRHHLEFVRVRLHPERFVVCAAEIVKDGVVCGTRDKSLHTYAFCNVAEELIHAENAGAAIDLGEGRATILMSFAEGDTEHIHLRALALMEMLIDIMKTQFGLAVTVGVGRGCIAMKDIPRSHDESQKALHYKMVFGHHSVISIEDLQPLDNQDYYRLTRTASGIAEALKGTDTDKMKALVKDTFREAVACNLPPELIRQLSFEFLMKSAQTADSIGIVSDPADIRLVDVYQRINGCEQLAEVERILFAFLEDLSAKISDKRQERGTNDTVSRMLAYIEQHYRESDLSLDKLAREFRLSPTYVSKQFKEHTERNFIDCLIEIRIGASQKLLADGELKVGEIAEAVGYMNARSFLRTFKKYTGMTPMEYRERAFRTRAVGTERE